ncbi:MAG: DUF3306 domain-containing protein [Caldimonas sp.]
MAADGFLARWSRKKSGEASAERDGAAAPAPPTPPDAGLVATPLRAPSPGLPTGAPSTSPPESLPPGAVAEPARLLTLDDVALLTPASDFSGFVARSVDPAVRNAAMKKLFADPHFNVMDGLDTYIDDYGKPDPIPLAMLRRMHQSGVLGLFDDEADADAPAAAKASTDGAEPLPLAQSAANDSAAAPPPASESPPDDDPDLRLQQDDASGRSGPGPSPRA